MQADEAACARLEALAAQLEDSVAEAVREAGAPFAVARVGSALTGFFRAEAPGDYAEAAQSDTGRFARFHRALIEGGVMLPPSQFEAWFVSLAHDEAVIERTVAAVAAALREAASEGARVSAVGGVAPTPPCRTSALRAARPTHPPRMFFLWGLLSHPPPGRPRRRTVRSPLSRGRGRRVRADGGQRSRPTCAWH